MPLGKEWTDIEFRKKLAECQIKETKAKKDAIELEIKNKNICRIDVALAEFNRVCRKHADAWKSLPDIIQSIIPSMSPSQYKQIGEFVETQLNILYNDGLRLELTPLEDERKEWRKEKGNNEQ